MQLVTSPAGAHVSFETWGNGPPLVLVHGAFSDHRSNWEFVRPHLARQFTVHAVARRGRGQTDATEGHGLEDEALDIAAVVQSIERSIGEPVFLLGHSYGAQVALAAALRLPTQVRKLVLYEPPWPQLMDTATLAHLEARAASGGWGAFAHAFFGDLLGVPPHELAALEASELWPPIVADARATIGDLRALSRHVFDVARFCSLQVPVMLQVGTESPRELYVTDALAAALPDARIEALPGQAHEGMTTAPAAYAESVVGFLLAESRVNPRCAPPAPCPRAACPG